MKGNETVNNRNTILTTILLALGCFVLCPLAKGVSPAPDGGYPGGNTAEGQNALFSLTTGGYNTAVGYFSLGSDTTEGFNTAVGAGALFANVAGSNTATGAGALLSNGTGGNNTATGAFALASNTGANANTAIGAAALYSETIGGGNTAVGSGALASCTGSFNTAVGDFAGANLTTGNNNIDIGYNVEGVAGESNTIRIGNTDINATIIRGISGTTIANGTTVLVAANGQLGTMTSSARFKDKIKPMDKSSEALFSLKPVTFHYKKEIDPKAIPQFGLVAEEVEKVNRDLVVHDEAGKPYSVRYDQVNAMLLNEFLKEHKASLEEHRKIEQQSREMERQKAAIAELKKDMEALIAVVKQHDSEMRKVTAQLELHGPVLQTVVGDY
jgi:endosialidase-like protein